MFHQAKLAHEADYPLKSTTITFLSSSTKPTSLAWEFCSKGFVSVSRALSQAKRMLHTKLAGPLKFEPLNCLNVHSNNNKNTFAYY